MEQFLIYGSYGLRNIGTEAILSGLIERFKREYSPNKIVVISANPKETSQMHKIRSINKFSINLIIDFLISNKIIIGGDELINDEYFSEIKYTKRFLYIKKIFEGKFLYILLILGWLFRKKIIIESIGIGTVTNKFTKRLLKIFNLSNNIFVRDAYSREKLLSIGINKNISMKNDPALELKNTPSKDLIEIQKKEGLYNKKYIVFTLKNEENLNKKIMTIIPMLIKWIIKKYDMNIVFIPFANHPNNLMERDIIIINKIIDNTKEKKKIKIINSNYHPSIINGIISKSKLVIGMRMHSIIFACMSNVPSICIPYSKKHNSVLNQLKFNSLFINYEELSLKKIKDSVKSLLYQQNDIS